MRRACEERHGRGAAARMFDGWEVCFQRIPIVREVALENMRIWKTLEKARTKTKAEI